MRKKCKLFAKIIQYVDVIEMLMLAKTKGLEQYKKMLKKELKGMLYDGISTKKRIDYWTTIGKLTEKKRSKPNIYSELQKKTSKSEMAISVDITRTYPSLEFFKYGNDGYNKLYRILKAISLVFSNIGYCQGMNFFSATLLLILGNEEVTLNFGC